MKILSLNYSGAAWFDIMPGTEEQLLKEMTATYIGFDPTSDSLYREFSAYNSFSTFKTLDINLLH
jgi:hypothetical protein